uniref:Uncharacterized protein n=1 Tax=Octopus bimaculoides TaxID=37653 RepID=A0A0L8I2E4_OCTBM
MKALGISTNSWEDLGADQTSWRGTLHKQLQTGEENLRVAAAENRACTKEMTTNRPDSTYGCDLCKRDCHSRIGLYSHRRRCKKLNRQLNRRMTSSMVSHNRRRPICIYIVQYQKIIERFKAKT